MTPPGKRIHRLATLGGTFLLAVMIAAGYAGWALHDDAKKAASPLYAQREMLRYELDPAKVPKRPFVAWIGDSTIADYGGGGMYPLEIERQTPELRAWLIACPGLDPYGDYFLMVCLGWLLFRAPSYADFVEVVGGLRHLGFASSRSSTDAILLVAAGVALHLAPDAEQLRRRFTALPPVAQGLAYAAAAIAAFLFTPGGERFIYFQF